MSHGLEPLDEGWSEKMSADYRVTIRLCWLLALFCWLQQLTLAGLLEKYCKINNQKIKFKFVKLPSKRFL